MDTSEPLFESDVTGLERIGRGKVRDIYSVDDDHLLIVTTDRLSAYDVVMPDPVPGKGQVLTQISNFWFEMMQDLIPNHLTDRELNSIIDDDETLHALEQRSIEQRSIVTRRLQPLPIEAVVRGYLIGSGWRDYQQTGQVCGIDLPPGLEQAAKLPQTLLITTKTSASKPCSR
jgi:phosphoribosylaminoimidazole-succinocarboxamide synthase